MPLIVTQLASSRSQRKENASESETQNIFGPFLMQTREKLLRKRGVDIDITISYILVIVKFSDSLLHFLNNTPKIIMNRFIRSTTRTIINLNNRRFLGVEVGDKVPIGFMKGKIDV